MSGTYEAFIKHLGKERRKERRKEGRKEGGGKEGEKEVEGEGRYKSKLWTSFRTLKAPNVSIIKLKPLHVFPCLVSNSR